MPGNIPDCYGKLFPELEKMRTNVNTQGVAFSAVAEGWGMGAKTTRTAVDRDQFVRCTHCPAYATCYDLSMAKLAFSAAAHERF